MYYTHMVAPLMATLVVEAEWPCWQLLVRMVAQLEASCWACHAMHKVVALASSLRQPLSCPAFAVLCCGFLTSLCPGPLVTLCQCPVLRHVVASHPRALVPEIQPILHTFSP